MALRTPLYDWHRTHGARLVEFGGWDMPLQYTSIVAEHQAVRTAVGLFDISHMGRLLFEGPHALDLIQQVFTNDAASMKLGQVRYGLICNEQGGVLDDVLVYRLEPIWLMVVNASNRPKVLAWIERHRGGRDVQVTDMTAEWAMIALQGPRAEEAMTARHSETAGTLKYYFGEARTVPGENDDEELVEIVSRTGYTGEDGFEIILSACQVESVWSRLLESSDRLPAPATPCGLGARDTLRLEAAMPLYDHELTEEIDPFQAGLGWAVKMDKGDFIGRQALARRRQDSTLRRRVGLELQGKRIARPGAAVVREGQEIGRVTSGSFVPTLGRAIAMAYVDPVHTQVSTACEVDVRGRPEPARVVPLPFYQRPKK